MASACAAASAAARAAGLRYTPDDRPGISRRRAGRGWRFFAPDGTPIVDQAEVRRLRALAIPPAWREVWINPQPRGHLQATGRDNRGRKQYRYHPAWRLSRDETKFSRLIAFAQALPRLRERVRADLGQPGLPRQKILAAVVRLLDESLIRVGNEEYARDNGSYGLTTLHDSHVDVSGETLHFVFRGKSGKVHEVDVRDRRVARLVKRLQDLPGQDLFQYLDAEGQQQSVGSEEVNAYLHEAAGEAFTAKDFRTWAGTVLAARSLRDQRPTDADASADNAAIVAAVDAVAARLGNTRAVCRAAYIHPAILRGYERGQLSRVRCPAVPRGLSPDERWTLAFLRSEP